MGVRLGGWVLTLMLLGLVMGGGCVRVGVIKSRRLGSDVGKVWALLVIRDWITYDERDGLDGSGGWADGGDGWGCVLV